MQAPVACKFVTSPTLFEVLWSKEPMSEETWYSKQRAREEDEGQQSGRGPIVRCCDVLPISPINPPVEEGQDDPFQGVMSR